MLNSFIHINDFSYYIEFDNSQDYASIHKAKYIMLRKFTLMNNVVCDNNLYFIERGLFDKLKQQIKNKEKITCLCFPSEGNHYSNHYTTFNDIMLDDDLINETLVYSLYDAKNIEESETINDLEEKYIKQNRLKIYHPHIKSKNDFIIHVENVINNIHMHYICNLYENFPVYSSEEIRRQNNIYSEYIEVKIPDIHDLFGMVIEGDTITYTTYYKEDLNIVETTSDKNKIFIEEIIKTTFNESSDNEVKKLISDEDNNLTQYLPLALLTQPFKLEENEDGSYKKKYFRHNLSVSNNFMTAPLTLFMFPYEYIDDSNNLYILQKDFMVGTTMFNYDYMFKLSSTCDFDATGKISFLSQIIYPKVIMSDENTNISTEEKTFKEFADAYCYYNGITNTDVYDVKYNELYKEYQEELREINCITSVPEEDKKIMVAINPNCLSMSSLELLEEYKRLKMESFLEEYIDEYKADIDFFGFRIEIGTDIHFKNIIFTQNQSLSKNFLKTRTAEELEHISFVDCLNNHVFTFNINRLFTDWQQMPESLIAKIYFIDRFTGFVIESNPVIVHKDKFKYIINDNDYYRLNSITENNNNLLTFKDNMKEYIAGPTAFNFIDTVKCIIHDDTENNNVLIGNIKDILNNTELTTDTDKINSIKTLLNGGNYSQTVNTNTTISNIIYQPIFFSTHTLDNVLIKKNMTQNIGIDLHEYVSAVDVFVLYLDDKKYTEIGRNSNYVMFNINALKLNATSGEYQLFNKDNEYITYGNWALI